MEFKIVSMKHTEYGYQVAVVLSYFDQKEYHLHNRWGSWFIGDPKEHGGREPATISKALPFELQEYLHDKKGARVEPARENVFKKRAAEKANVFVRKAKERTNPFIAKVAK